MTKRRRKSDMQIHSQPIMKHVVSHLYLYLLLIMLFFVMAISLANYGVNNFPINSEKNAILEQPWQYSIGDQDFRSIDLPAKLKHNFAPQVILKNRTPSELVKGATFLIRTSQQNVKVYVEDTLLYCSYENEETAQPSSAYHFVRLPTDALEKEVTVIISSPYKNFFGLINEIYIGSKASHIFFLVGTSGFRLVIGFIVFVAGFLLLVSFAFAKKQATNGGVIYLGGFFACAGFWVLAESKLMQFLIPHPTLLTNLSIFALTLLPVFLGLYYLMAHVRQLVRPVKVASLVMAIVSFTMAVLSLFDLSFPIRMLSNYLVLLGIFVAFFFGILFWEYRKEKGSLAISFWGVISFSACCLFELISYFYSRQSYNNSNFFTFGLFLFCVTMLVDFVFGFTKAYQSTVQVKMLTTLAYTDSLTGLQNRASFLEKIQRIVNSTTTEHGRSRISLMMFDVNNLKNVNDEQGHIMGDLLLKSCAQVLQRSIRMPDDLFRIGGDEFVAMIYHEANFAPEQLEKRLQENILDENEKLTNFRLSIAYGFATYQASDPDLLATLARADEKMYECKKKQKHME